jgi:peptide/nickel transport system substrate-binding protein
MSQSIRRIRLGTIVALTAGALIISTVAAPATEKSKDTIVVAIAGDINNFDPHTNQLIIYAYGVKFLVFSSLVKYDVSMKVQPDLATFSVNKDATVFTFKINPKAVFQDGTPVTASSVVLSLKRAAGTTKSIFTSRFKDVKSYAAPAKDTVVITLNGPDAAFLASLTEISIVAPSNFGKVGSRPVGSGPYKFVSWQSNKQIVFTRFDKYFGTPGGSKTIIEKPMPDEQVALNALYSGDVDIIAGASAATVKQLDTSRAKVVRPKTSNSMSFVEFNVTGKLSDVRVRQALAYALDKASIKAITYGGGGSSTWSPLPESSWAYSAQAGYPYDLTKAKALLTAAGVSNLTFDLEIPAGYPEAESLARVWQQSLAQIGVTMNPNVTEISVWIDKYINRKYAVTWNVFNVPADPNGFFDVIMGAHFTDDYKNQTAITLAAKAKSLGDRTARAKIYAQLQKIMVDELPVMMIQSVPVASLTGKNVAGYQINPLGWALISQAKISK